ncbi:MAG: endonuclease/exonuclease/phosphatase family protein [Actinomycetota bacterium]
MSLRFLSWNLAMLERSAQSPAGWEQFQAEAAVRELVLDLAPDVVCYQELPAMVPFVETHDLLPATPRSHSGNLATLVTHPLRAADPQVTAVPGCAVLATFGLEGGSEPPFTLANVHLQSGRGAAGDRLAQLARVVETSPTPRLLVVGDTNLRVDETDALADAGLVGARPPRPTWDSRRNRFRADGHEFVAYFTRWFTSPGLEVTDVRVHDEPLVVDGRRFHLSDHYALSGTVTVTDW